MHAKQGDWIEIHTIVLDSGERASQVPEDTQAVPLEMRVKGFATTDGSIGEEMKICTLNGHSMLGELISVNPAYPHGYGNPVLELLPIGLELRALLEEESS